MFPSSHTYPCISIISCIRSCIHPSSHSNPTLTLTLTLTLSVSSIHYPLLHCYLSFYLDFAPQAFASKGVRRGFLEWWPLMTPNDPRHNAISSTVWVSVVVVVRVRGNNVTHESSYSELTPPKPSQTRLNPMSPSGEPHCVKSMDEIGSYNSDLFKRHLGENLIILEITGLGLGLGLGFGFGFGFRFGFGLGFRV